jgi:hypothetical protein
VAAATLAAAIFMASSPTAMLSGRTASGFMMRTVQPMTPSFFLQTAKPMSMTLSFVSPQYLRWPDWNFSVRWRWPVSLPLMMTWQPCAPDCMTRWTVLWPAEVPAALEGLGELDGHDLRVQAGVTAGLDDLDLGVLDLEALVERLGEHVDRRALAADDHAGTLGQDRDARAHRGPLDLDAAEAGALGLLLEELADHEAVDSFTDELALDRHG